MSANIKELWIFGCRSVRFWTKSALISFAILGLSREMCATEPCEGRAYIRARDSQAALLNAMNHGDTPGALRLIDGALDVNAKDTSCRTPLHWAAQWGRAEVVRALIKAGAEVNVTDQQGGTPLALAYLFGHFDVVQVLLKAGADSSQVPDLKGVSDLNAPLETGSQTYIDNNYKVALRFPSAWTRDASNQDRPYFSSKRKWKPRSVVHSFQLLVLGDESATPEQTCKGEAEHVLKPYGDNPVIHQTKVDGRKACLIYPSKGQGPAAYAGAFVKYPNPVEIEGNRYSILALYADKSFFRDMIESLHFISAGHRNPPFLITIAPTQVDNTWKNDAGFSLLLTMKNTSDKVLQVSLGDPASDYRVIVMHNAEPARVTVENKESQAATVPIRNTTEILKPNETCEATIQVKFWADRMPTGEYTLQVERDLPSELGKGLLESNTITVTVIKSEAVD